MQLVRVLMQLIWMLDLMIAGGTTHLTLMSTGDKLDFEQLMMSYHSDRDTTYIFTATEDARQLGLVDKLKVWYQVILLLAYTS